MVSISNECPVGVNFQRKIHHLPLPIMMLCVNKGALYFGCGSRLPHHCWFPVDFNKDRRLICSSARKQANNIWHNCLPPVETDTMQHVSVEKILHKDSPRYLLPWVLSWIHSCPWLAYMTEAGWRTAARWLYIKHQHIATYSLAMPGNAALYHTALPRSWALAGEREKTRTKTECCSSSSQALPMTSWHTVPNDTLILGC